MHDSVTQWFLGLQEERDHDHHEALRRLWDRYFDRVVAAARKRLGDAPRRVADEEDIAVSVFASLCRGAAAGRFQDLRRRDDLWRVLLAITRQKAVDRIRHEVRQKRGGGDVRGESVFVRVADGDDRAGLEAFAASTPTPEDLALIEEQARELLAALPENVRDFARLRLEGYEQTEIAEKLGVSLSTVERKLRVIRRVWAGKLGMANSTHED